MLPLEPALIGAEPLLQTHAELCKIRAAGKRIERHLVDEPRAKGLTTVPSVGAVTAIILAAVLDDPARFSCAKLFCAYAGLV